MLGGSEVTRMNTRDEKEGESPAQANDSDRLLIIARG